MNQAMQLATKRGRGPSLGGQALAELDAVEGYTKGLPYEIPVMVDPCAGPVRRSLHIDLRCGSSQSLVPDSGLLLEKTRIRRSVPRFGLDMQLMQFRV